MENIASVNANSHDCKWKIWNATTLKLLAVFFMLLDHIHQMFAYRGAPLWLTMAGRMVFPIFLFASAESFYYTHSKKKYLQRSFVCKLGNDDFYFFPAKSDSQRKCGFDEQRVQHFFCDRTVSVILGLFYRRDKEKIAEENRKSCFIRFPSFFICTACLSGRCAFV